MKIDLNIYKLKNVNVSTKWPLKSALLAFIVFTFFLSPFLYGQNPFIPRYDAVKRSERCFTVTFDTFNQFGAVWWAQKVDFSRDTAFNFVVYMGNRNNDGADGLAFVMHQDPRDTLLDTSKQIIIGGAGTWDLSAATGDDGGGLGFAMHQSRVGPNTIPGPHGPGDDPENHKIQKSVAIEIDTWNNSDVPDGNAGNDANGVNQVVSPFYGWDHASVVYNGDIYGQQQVITDGQGNTGRILPLKPGYIFGTGNNPDGSVYHNIEDDRCYMFQVKWIVNPDGTQTMQLWADMYNGSTNLTGLEMVMTHTDDMLTKVFNGNPVMRFGFTGSTGGARNEQTICLLGENLKPFAQNDFASIPLNATATIDVEANDNDPDGDQLHVPVIVDQANNGSAMIFDSLGINYMRYTPNTNFVGTDTVGYVTCDVNSIKCYAKCDTALVFITVGCVPFDVDLTATAANTTCSTSTPGNGAASADISASFIRGTLWSEGFEDSANGATSDNGPTSWTSSTSGACTAGNQIRVQTNEYQVRQSGCVVLFETEIIDISAVNDVGISVDIRAAGDMEPADFLRVYYKLDGGPLTFLNNGNQTDNFGTKQAAVPILNGNTLQIVIEAQNSGGDEIYNWDNIHVTAVGAGVPDVTINWYQGATLSGPIVNTGTVFNGMNHGIYTVVGVDNATGCISNPSNVTIDSTGYNVKDGYINPMSPFTNCNLPYDGALAAGVLDGIDSVTVGYEFEWYYQEDPKLPAFIQRTGFLASNLESREYTVVITEIATGCDTAINAEVPNAVNIPLIVATKIQDILSCSDPNSGIGSATVGGTTNGYRFEWYAGPAIGAGPPDFTGAQVNTFGSGTYTVQAIDSITSCPSDPATITFNDLTVLPNVQINLDQQQISCDPLFQTGQVSGSVLVSGTPTTSGFAFNWYKGPNDIVPARAGYTGGPVADQLDAGLYRLVVVENGTNCTAFKDTTILDQLVTPAAITVTTTPVTFCNSDNGSITVNVVGSPANYTYEVYRGSGVIPANLVTASNTNIILNLSADTYTVIAKDIITKCPTAPVFATINDVTVLPLATISSQDQVSCDPNNLTGALTVSTAPMPVSDFSIEWFKNDTTTLPLPPTSPNSISRLDTGTYAVRITNNTTQCKNVYYPVVDPGIVLPVEAVTATSSTFCAPSANGQLSASADTGRTAGYSFIWVEVTSGDTLASQAAVVNGIAPGDYSLRIRNNTTACYSNPATINVADNTIIPVPTISIADNSSCNVALPNGSLTVTATNEAPTYTLGDYTYAWFNNSSGIAVPNVGGSFGESAISLSAGTYELRIRNNTTSCANSVLSQIIDINIKPVIDGVIPDHADHCVEPFMSGATVVSVNGGPIPVGFTFSWFNRDGGPAISSITGSIADMNNADEILPPGNYGVVGLNQFSCPSDTVLFEIIDNSIPPVFQLNPFNNISCDPGIPLGSLVVSRPNPSYTISLYEWFLGAPGSPFNSSSNGNDSLQINLAAGIYAVRITDANTGCTSVEFANIQNAPSAKPSIINTALIDLTRCDIDNGELAYRVLPFENIPPLNTTPRNYTFHLTGSSTYQQTTAGTDNANFLGLAAGNWSAFVVDEYTKCQSDPINSILDQAPEIRISSQIISKPTSCIGNDGILKIMAETALNDSISGGVGFSFNWFLGFDGSKGSVPSVTAPNNFRSTAINLTSDYYFIEVQDLQTTCKKDTAIFIPAIQLPDLDPVVGLPSDRCDAFGNGSVTAGLQNFTLPYGYSDYIFRLYQGQYYDPDNLAFNLVSIISNPAGPVSFPSNLTPGDYTMVVIEDFGSSCKTVPVSFTIDLNYSLPTLTVAPTPDKSCLGAAVGTGELEVTSTNPALPLGNLSFVWSNGDIGPQTSSTLFSANYSLEATITANIPGQGCKIDTILNVPKILDNITLVGTPTPNYNCAPFDGTIVITDVRENGTSIGGVPGNYVNFIIYDSNLAAFAPSVGNGTAVPWSPLAPGNYFVQAQNNDTKCYSEFANLTINDLSVDPVISITVNSPDYACNPILANGELSAIVSGSTNLIDYQFNWYTGAVNPANFIINNPVVSNRSANSFGQIYTMEAVDQVGPNLGCRSQKQVTLTHQPTKVYMLSTDIDTLNQTICGPNGSIQITQINEDDGSGAIPYPPSATYSAQLLSASLNPIDPIANPFAIYDVNSGYFGSGNVPAGSYYVRASNVTTGCQYGPISQVIVKDVSKKPIISATLISPDYACAGGIHTGELAPTVFGGSDLDPLPTNFAITWKVKANGANAPGGTTATTLWPGTYTLQVVDATGLDQGCVSTRDYVVPAARRNISLTASGTDQSVCFPNGTIQVNNISVDAVNEVNPHLTWTSTLFDAANRPIVPVPTGSGFASNVDPYTGLAAGTYFVKVQNDSTKCYSNPYQVRLRDISTDPVISVALISPQYSLNPNPASWTGAMQATVTETNGAPEPGGYIYAWHQGTGTGNPAFSAIDNIAMSDEGNYTFVATNNTTLCQTIYNAYLPYVYLEPKFNTLSFAKTICAPNDGSIEITSITLDGNPDLLSDYTFSVFHDTFSPGDPADQIIPGNNAGTTYPNINDGDYYFVAKENWWWVESFPVKVTVIDSTTNPIIVFSATDYRPVTSCDESIYADGALSVDIFEDPSNPNLSPPFNYGFTWYSGATVDPANILPGDTTNSLTDVVSGNYTVVVVNLDNNCQGQKTFQIEDDSVIPIVAATQTPNTNCPDAPANGIVSVTVINSNATYNFNWYTGTTVGSTPEYNGEIWRDRQPTDYTVVAIDPNLPTCISAPKTIKVENATEDPIVVIKEIAPISNCDPDRPNGVLSAVTQDGISGHTFEWYYEGTLYSTGPVASNLGLFTYDLIVTNDITKCRTNLSSAPSRLLGVIPPPDVEILSDRTSCLKPDGNATATVSGNVVDYIFRFYNKFSGQELTNLYDDFKIYDLDTSTYLVTAENRSTGCVSDPTEFSIDNASYFPSIEVIADPSACNEPNGAANVIISDLTQDFKVTWYGDNGFVAQEKELVYLPVGKYLVEVEGTDGCISSAEAEVKADIVIYNGISANNDGSNDFFHILCLELFMNNNVKIYNRAGMLVYDQDGYDMNVAEKRFNGISNKGTSILGTELPIGTYFYVVDKSDGSKPKVGYLELVR